MPNNGGIIHFLALQDNFLIILSILFPTYAIKFLRNNLLLFLLLQLCPTIKQRWDHKFLHGNMGCLIHLHIHIHTHAHTVFISFIFITSISHVNTGYAGEGRNGGSRAHVSWMATFLCGSKGLNNPGIWGMWSPSPESWKVLGSRKLLRHSNPQSVYREHSKWLGL